MRHDFFSLRHRTEPADLSDYGRKLDRRRGSLGGSYRVDLNDQLRARPFAAPGTPGSEAIGQAVWKSAVRARRLGASVALVRDADEMAFLDEAPGRAVVTACLGGLCLWACVLFLLGLD